VNRAARGSAEIRHIPVRRFPGSLGRPVGRHSDIFDDVDRSGHRDGGPAMATAASPILELLQAGGCIVVLGINWHGYETILQVSAEFFE
jgi:hypothetical protein